MQCSRCRRTLSADEPVYRCYVHDGRGAYDFRSWQCEPCCTSWRLGPNAEWWWQHHKSQWRAAALRCEGCARPVLIKAKHRLPRHVVCSDACRKVAKLAQARERRAARRGTVICQSYGERFPPKRTDARLCSAACRQRAYRGR
jgi:hypothetical protein